GFVRVMPHRTVLSRRLIITSARRRAAVESDKRDSSTMAVIIALLKRDMMRAAQKASAASIWLKAGLGYSVFHVAGSNTSASMLPIEVCLGHFADCQSRA